jgi:D-xylose transport system permease protein
MATTIKADTPTQTTKTRPTLTKSVSIRDFSMVIALLMIWTYFGVVSPVFLSPRNLSNLAVELSITAVLSLGMLLIIVCGEIDLSIGSGVGLFGGVAAVLVFNHGWPAAAAMGVSLVIAVLVWLAMGKLIVSQRIPAFIVTLAGMMVFRGLHWRVIQDATIPVTTGGHDNLYSLLTTWYLPPTASWVLAALVIAAVSYGTVAARKRRLAFNLAVEESDVVVSKLIITGQIIFLFTLICNEYRGIPLSAIILGVTAFIVWGISRHTPFGRYLYAIGGNAEAAFVSGVPVQRVIIGAFGIMGLIVALGGFMQTAYAGASTTTTGELLELDAIAACVIGGASLTGGRGTVPGVLFGSLIMASLLNGMTLMAVSPEMKYIARGLVLALAVWLDTRMNRR